MSTPPLTIVPLLTPFAVAFTAPTFRHVLILVSGTILASGRRTVAAALRVVGLGEERRFTTLADRERCPNGDGLPCTPYRRWYRR